MSQKILVLPFHWDPRKKIPCHLAHHTTGTLLALCGGIINQFDNDSIICRYIFWLLVVAIFPINFLRHLLAATTPPCVTFRLVDVPLRGPGQSPILPFACCVGSLLSVGRCGWCSCWCRFRVRGAQ